MLYELEEEENDDYFDDEFLDLWSDEEDEDDLDEDW
jgi:hypothetical protein